MRLRYPFIAGLAACVALASCTDVAGPPPGRDSAAPAQPSLVKRQLTVVLEDPTAPPLELYSLEFWVVQGVGKTVQVNYRPGNNGLSNRFLRLVIPKQTQLYPDGSPLASGDSVLISAVIDASQLLVRFEPHGLVFGGSQSASLRLHWANANLDLNGDGLVDALDQEIIRSLLVIAYQTSEGEPWSIPDGQVKSLQGQYIEIPLQHFSGYAVSW